MFFFFQAEDGIRDLYVTGVQTCALPICARPPARAPARRGTAARRAAYPPRQRAARPAGGAVILTAATWNLREGGIDNGSDTRLRRQLTLLAGLNLDVAAFQECKHWADDDSALLHLAEEQLGMTGFLAESAHHGCHLAVFVRESAGLQVIEPRHERGHPYWHAVARVLVRAESLHEPLYLASLHFAPSSPVIR